jgi:hypothetical protein
MATAMVTVTVAVAAIVIAARLALMLMLMSILETPIAAVLGKATAVACHMTTTIVVKGWTR